MTALAFGTQATLLSGWSTPQYIGYIFIFIDYIF